MTSTTTHPTPTHGDIRRAFGLDPTCTGGVITIELDPPTAPDDATTWRNAGCPGGTACTCQHVPFTSGAPR